MDRRILKTRKALQEALITLLREKPLEAIEIQEIADVADTARVTFYRHYGTKQELLVDAIEQIYQALIVQLGDITLEHVLNPAQTPPMTKLFEFLAQDRTFYKRLFLGSASALIQQRLRHYFVEEVNKTFSVDPRSEGAPIYLIANHIASANIGNIMWWLVDDVPYSPEVMGQFTHRMAMQGVMIFMDDDGADLLTELMR
jgi:AcrR family transcriptional regulator